MMHHLFERRGHGTGTVVGFSLFSAIAAAAATYYLYATKAGTRKRMKLEKLAGELKDRAEEKIDSVRDSIDM